MKCLAGAHCATLLSRVTCVVAGTCYSATVLSCVTPVVKCLVGDRHYTTLLSCVTHVVAGACYSATMFLYCPCCDMFGGSPPLCYIVIPCDLCRAGACCSATMLSYVTHVVKHLAGACHRSTLLSQVTYVVAGACCSAVL